MIHAASLFRFLDAARGPIGWRESGPLPIGKRFEFTSQEWRGHEWTHPLWWSVPERRLDPSTAVLYVTGDEVPSADLADVQQLTRAVSLPVATLFAVPNQPLWGLREDDLIAETLVRYLGSLEEDWPLLFPMTQAVMAAMDVVQTIDSQIERFIITGGSKRGWTTWMAAATQDPRIIGIAPMVFDHLNFPIQAKAQRLAFHGGISPRLVDYSRRSLMDLLESENGARLGAALDPFTYRDRISIPKWQIHGTNDAFWPVDAAKHYIGELKGEVALTTIPNVGHDLGDRRSAHAAVGALVRHVLRGVPLTHPDTVSGPIHWRASSDTRDFTQAVWSSSAGEGSFIGYIAEMPISIDGIDASVTSIPVVESRD